MSYRLKEAVFDSKSVAGLHSCQVLTVEQIDVNQLQAYSCLTASKSWRTPDPDDESSNNWNIGKEVSSFSCPRFEGQQ